MKILVLDNYDSFTYNLVHYMEKVSEHPIDVFKNDKITLEEASKYDKILLSPGPGLPAESGILIPLIKELGATKDIFGVCLGQQAIIEAFGGSLINLEKVYHGVATKIKVTHDDLIYNHVPNEFKAGRYHSWVIDPKTLPKDFIITAEDENGQVMSIAHKKLKLRAVQYHPESILTENGEKIIENWMNA